MNFSKRFLHTTLCMILILIFLCPTALAAPKLVLADGSAIPTIMPCNSTYTIKDSSSTDVYFKSSDKSIATIGRTSGKLTTLNPGTVTIYSYNKSTDTSRAKLTISVKKRAETIKLNYSKIYFATASDSFYHYAKCQNDDCTIVEDTKQRHYEEHNFNNNTCRTCGYVRTEIAGHTHSWTSYKYDSSRHLLVCESSECGATKSPEIHNFGSDNKCKVCKITHEHNSWEEAVSPDAGAHRNSCQSCDGTQAWYQDIGKSYPSFSGGTVYPVGNHGDELIYANENPKAAVVNNGKNIIVLFADSPCMLVVALYKDGKLADTKPKISPKRRQ